jgi:hypothetical protein
MRQSEVDLATCNAVALTPTRSTGGNYRHKSLRLQLLPARAFILLPLPQPDTWAPAVLVDELHPG